MRPRSAPRCPTVLRHEDDEDGAGGVTIVPGGETVAAAGPFAADGQIVAEGTATGEAVATGDPAATDSETPIHSRES
jgi:hypothetical protein